jgi:NAD(P)-dependent dehydrogenase (short-subunit alcohol dehydrogenase family)
MANKETAVIVGVGPGLGAALARRFATADFIVAIAARDQSKLHAIATAIGPDVHAYCCDVTEEDQVDRLFQAVEQELGAPGVAIHNAGPYLRKSILDTTKDDLEGCWRSTCLGGFLVGRAAARIMVPRGRGTILFTGATASLRGSALFHNTAVGKFGLRAIAQSMARELQPKGVHVAHVVIDGPIDTADVRAILSDRDPESLLPPEDIAEAYYQLHRQRHGAWTQELDLRSWKEVF